MDGSRPETSTAVWTVAAQQNREQYWLAHPAVSRLPTQ
jgi:hypothetical protein